MQEVDSTGTLKAGEKALAELRKRKLIVQKYVTGINYTRHSNLTCFRKGQWFTIHKGKNFSTSTAKPETDLTAEMLASYVIESHLQICAHSARCSGAWKTSVFKKYNFEAEGQQLNGGALHPLLKVREEIRNIFLEMGYVGR